MNTASPELRPQASLHVYDRVPTAELVVYNASYGQVARGVGELQVDLPAGVYEVESLVGADHQRQFVVLNPGGSETVVVQREKLNFASAAPLEYTTTAREWHTYPAIDWSRKATMPALPDRQALPGAQSRLYVFVRTLQPEKFGETYDQHLKLLDENGKLLCDFTSGVERHPEHGWTALNVELPPGFYQLYRGGRGRPARFQSLWLCPEWETQVFIPGREMPMLNEMALFMARFGAGFEPNDETSLAVETILDGLRRGRNLASSQEMHFLLDSKFQNPWLGILALHALRLDPDNAYSNLSGIVYNNTYGMIGEHPDLMALNLQGDLPPGLPFEFPPVLWASLRLLQQHASRVAGTVQEGSLAARVFDTLVSDSDWVAWRRLPPQNRQPKRIASTDNLFFVQGGSKWLIPSVEQSGLEGSFSYGDLEGSVTLADLFDNPDTPETNPLVADLLWLIETIPFDSDPGSIPYAVNPGELFYTQDSERISRQLNIPLDKVQSALRRIQETPELLGQPRLMTITELTITDQVLRRRSVKGTPATRGAEAALLSLSASISALSQAAQALKRLYKAQARKTDLSYLQAQFERFAGWLRARQDAVLLVDANAQVVYANPAFEGLTGHTRSELAALRVVDSGAPVLDELGQMAGNRRHFTLPEGEAGGYDCQRISIVDEMSYGLVATLYRVRPSGRAPLQPQDLGDIRHRLYNIVLYASLALYGQAKQAEYLGRLERDVNLLAAYTS